MFVWIFSSWESGFKRIFFLSGSCTECLILCAGFHLVELHQGAVIEWLFHWILLTYWQLFKNYARDDEANYAVHGILIFVRRIFHSTVWLHCKNYATIGEAHFWINPMNIKISVFNNHSLTQCLCMYDFLIFFVVCWSRCNFSLMFGCVLLWCCLWLVICVVESCVSSRLVDDLHPSSVHNFTGISG